MAQKYEPTDKDRKLVEMMSVWATVDQICNVIGLARATIYKHYKAEIQSGKDKKNAEVVDSLFKMTKRIPAAAIFWCKTRLGWREVDNSASNEPTVINLNFETKPGRITDGVNTTDERKTGT